MFQNSLFLTGVRTRFPNDWMWCYEVLGITNSHYITQIEGKLVVDHILKDFLISLPVYWIIILEFINFCKCCIPLWEKWSLLKQVCVWIFYHIKWYSVHRLFKMEYSFQTHYSRCHGEQCWYANVAWRARSERKVKAKLFLYHWLIWKSISSIFKCFTFLSSVDRKMQMNGFYCLWRGSKKTWWN